MTNKQYCTIYIVRHGETDANLTHTIQGQSNSALNSKGKIQAKQISRKLKKITFDNIFSSDLLRAKQTADILALERKLAVQTSQTLRERRWGRLEGKSTKLIKTIEEFKSKLSEEEKFLYKAHPDVESDQEIAARALTFLREVAVGYSGKTILIISHGGLMRILLDHLGIKVGHGAIPNMGYLKLISDGVDFYIKETNFLN